MNNINPKFVNVKAAAVKLGVPAAWLRREADEGRIPCLRAGRKILFDLDVVVSNLTERATNSSNEVAQ